MSIMEILATAAVTEINRRVNDSCAVIRLEMRRSQRDIDGLKRKCHLMETELRRTRGRVRRRGPVLGIPERCTPTPRSMCMHDRNDEQTIDTPNEKPPAENTEAQPSEVPLIKEETVEEDSQAWGGERDGLKFSLQGLDGVGSTLEKNGTHATPYTQDDTHTFETLNTTQLNTGEQEATVTLEVQIKAEEVEMGGTNKGEEAKKEERGEGEAEGEQQHLLDDGSLGEGEFDMQQSSATVWTTSANDFNKDTLTPSQSQSIVPAPSQCVPPLPSLGSASTSIMNQPGHSGAMTIRTGIRSRWGMEAEGKTHNPGHMTRELYPSRPQLGFRSVGGTTLGLSGYRGNNTNTISGFGSTSVTGFHVGALRRLRPHQWRSVGLTTSSTSSASSTLSLSSSSASSSSVSCAARRVFACSFCPKSFARLSQLKEHMRSHTGEKPYSCGTCGRRFTKQCNLVRHAVVHSGEKPYPCPTCGKCFTQSSSLKSHQRTHLLPRREGTLAGRTQLRPQGMLIGAAAATNNYKGFT